MVQQLSAHLIYILTVAENAGGLSRTVSYASCVCFQAALASWLYFWSWLYLRHHGVTSSQSPRLTLGDAKPLSLFLTMGNNIPALHPVLGLKLPYWLILTERNLYYALYLKANKISVAIVFLLDLFMKLFSNQILRCKLKIAFTDTYSIKLVFQSYMKFIPQERM